MRQIKGTQSTQHLNLLRSILPLLITLLTLFSPLSNAQTNKPIIIAITQIIEHPSLTQAKKGILDELQESGYTDNQNIKVITENAQGSITQAAMIAKKLVAIQPDVIVPISTPSAQTVIKTAQKTDIPIVFSSVTDPIDARLVKDLNIAVTNITGAMDPPPLEELIALITKLVPHIKTLGVIYNSGEANSVKTIALLKEVAGNIQIIEAIAPNTNQVGQAMLSLQGKVDAIYLPSDNTVFSAMPALVKIAKQKQIPVFSSDPDSVTLGVLACVGYTQYQVGRTAGKLIVKILQGERTLKITKPEKSEIFLNEFTAEHLNLKIPDSLKANGVKS